MMPGSEPYTPSELDDLRLLVSAASEGDPGEEGEPETTYCREVVLSYGPRLRPPGDAIGDSRDVARLVRSLIGDRVVEHFVVVALDSKNRPVAWMTIAVGGVAACPVAPADVLRLAVITASPAIVVAHNHPSGDTTPSADDVALTGRLVEGARLLGIRFLDHVIVGPDAASYSFLDAGRLTSGGTR